MCSKKRIPCHMAIARLRVDANRSLSNPARRVCNLPGIAEGVRERSRIVAKGVPCLVQPSCAQTGQSLLFPWLEWEEWEECALGDRFRIIPGSGQRVSSRNHPAFRETVVPCASTTATGLLDLFSFRNRDRLTASKLSQGSSGV